MFESREELRSQRDALREECDNLRVRLQNAEAEVRNRVEYDRGGVLTKVIDALRIPGYDNDPRHASYCPFLVGKFWDDVETTLRVRKERAEAAREERARAFKEERDARTEKRISSLIRRDISEETN